MLEIKKFEATVKALSIEKQLAFAKQAEALELASRATAAADTERAKLLASLQEQKVQQEKQKQAYLQIHAPGTHQRGCHPRMRTAYERRLLILSGIETFWIRAQIQTLTPTKRQRPDQATLGIQQPLQLN